MNKYNFGLKNVHYAKFKYDDATAKYTFETPKRIACAVNMSISPVGDESKFFCDDVVGINVQSNQGYEGTFTGATLSEDFRIDILGEKKQTDGLRVEYANVQPSPFALIFEIDGDESKTRFVYYNCKAGRPGQEHNTKTESVEVDTQELTFNASPRLNDSAVRAYANQEDTAYAQMLTKIVEPTV